MERILTIEIISMRILQAVLALTGVDAITGHDWWTFGLIVMAFIAAQAKVDRDLAALKELLNAD